MVVLHERLLHSPWFLTLDSCRNALRGVFRTKPNCQPRQCAGDAGSWTFELEMGGDIGQIGDEQGRGRGGDIVAARFRAAHRAQP